ncbi:MAG TPA: DUF5615 family PIN-like protein [Flavipsychrobacter sp.]|nr:DUF5615 family PIN-like protein [Flavipsychrobacter sp.]
MILADENVHGAIIRSLNAAGITTDLVARIQVGMDDENVIKAAINGNFILLTEDKDFGEWVFAHHITGLSVIFLRYTVSEVAQISDSLLYLLNGHLPEPPFFATITTKKIRIRKL